MDNYCKNNVVDNIISLGDNFYFFGIKNVQDNLIKSVYENVYLTKEHLKHLNWFIIAGNHDWNNMNGAYPQVEYSKINSNWIYPSFSYTREFNITDELQFQIIFFDSTLFIPSERMKYKIGEESKEKRTKWLKDVLENGDGKFKWRFFIQHHPFYNAGKYGNMGNVYMKEIENLIHEYKIDSVFSGHQHSMQYLKLNDKATNFFVNGGGCCSYGTRIEHNPHMKFAQVFNGFFALDVDESKYTIKMIDFNGNILFNKEFD